MRRPEANTKVSKANTQDYIEREYSALVIPVFALALALLLQERDRLDSSHFEALAAAHILAGDHVVLADHV